MPCCISPTDKPYESICAGRHKLIDMLPLFLPVPSPCQKVEFQERFPAADPLAIDLLQRMLAFDPRERLTVVQALEHPWLDDVRDQLAEGEAPGENRGQACTCRHASFRACDGLCVRVRQLHQVGATLNSAGRHRHRPWQPPGALTS